MKVYDSSHHYNFNKPHDVINMYKQQDTLAELVISTKLLYVEPG